jgi:ribosomal-protein-alanine N-acetyltransferase
MSLPELNTERTRLVLLPPSAAAKVARYNRDNREHFAPWDPARPAGFYQESFWVAQLARNIDDFENDRGARMWIVDREDDGLIGTVNFSNVVRGAFQACTLGYGVHRAREGKGYMYEALREALRYAFADLRLHRIQANYMPENQRSARLLERLGFVIEGRAKNYLLIAGQWRDHILTSLTNDGHAK